KQFHNLLPYVRNYFRNFPGVRGVGIGLKQTAGKLTNTLCWRVYVDNKLPAMLLSPAGFILPQLYGQHTDVISCGQTKQSSGLELRSGSQIVNNRGIPGTAGCFFSDATTSHVYLLSNYHVLFGKGAAEGESLWCRH